MHPNNFLLPGHNTYLAEYVKKSGKIHIPILTLALISSPRTLRPHWLPEKPTSLPWPVVPLPMQPW